MAIMWTVERWDAGNPEWIPMNGISFLTKKAAMDEQREWCTDNVKGVLEYRIVKYERVEPKERKRI